MVDAKGNAKILDVNGAGQSCVEATRNFEAKLGQAKEESRQLTESYYELPEQTTDLEQEGG